MDLDYCINKREIPKSLTTILFKHSKLIKRNHLFLIQLLWII
jgi:hypothetical protein